MLYIKNSVFILLCAQPGHSVHRLKQWFGHQNESQKMANNQASHTIPHTMPANDTKESIPQTSDPCMEEYENEYHVISDNGSNISDNITDYVPSISLHNERCDPGTIYICGVPDRLSIIPEKYAENTNGHVITFENVAFSNQEQEGNPKNLNIGTVHSAPYTTALVFKNCNLQKVATHNDLQTITLDRQTLNRIMPNDTALNQYHRTVFQTKRPFIERILTEEQCNGVKCLLDGQKNHRWFWHQSQTDEWCFQRFNPHGITCISSLDQYNAIPLCGGIKMVNIKNTHHDTLDHRHNRQGDSGIAPPRDLRNKKIHTLILEQCQFSDLVNSQNMNKLTIDDDTLNSLFPFGPIILCSNVPGYDQMLKERMKTIKTWQWSKLGKILAHNTSSPWEWHYNGAKKHTVFFPKKTKDCPDSEDSDNSDN